MNISKEIKDDLTAVISLNITQEDYQPQVEQEMKKYRKQASVKGFRKGNAPMGLIKRMVGNSFVAQEIDKMVSKTLSDFIKKEGMSLLGQPLPSTDQKPLDLDNNKEHNFLFEVGVAPELEVTLDKRIKIPFYTIKIDDELVKKEKDRYTQQHGAMEEKEEIKEKSYLKADIKESDEAGNIIEEGVLAEGTSLAIDIIKDEEIKKQFIDKKVGDTLTVDIKKAYPNDTEISSMLGIDKERVEEISSFFNVTINEIREFNKAEINQEFFDKAFGEGEVKSEEEFTEKIKSGINEIYEQESNFRFGIDAKDKLVEKINPKLPDNFLKRWLLETDEDGKLAGGELEKEYPRFQEDLQWRVINNRIAEQEKFKVEETEIKEEALKATQAQMQQYGISLATLPPETVDQFVNKSLEKHEDVQRFTEKVIENKVVKFIKKQAKFQAIYQRSSGTYQYFSLKIHRSTSRNFSRHSFLSSHE